MPTCEASIPMEYGISPDIFVLFSRGHRSGRRDREPQGDDYNFPVGREQQFRFVVAKKAMQVAIQKAKEFHFGAVSTYNAKKDALFVDLNRLPRSSCIGLIL